MPANTDQAPAEDSRPSRDPAGGEPAQPEKQRGVLKPSPASPNESANGPGLTAAEARVRLDHFGANAVASEKPHPLKALLKRFWAPIPWLLEASIIIQLCIGETLEAAVIGALLLANGLLGWLQEGRAERALALLRQQLRVQARVRRDGQWLTVPAEELVPGDLIHLRQGSLVPADVKVADGTLLVDQSALTGESSAVSVEPGGLAYAGGMVRGGEVNGEVAATGAHTFFGKTAELVRIAGAFNRQEQEMAAIVRNLFVANAAAVVVVLGYAHLHGLSLGYILPLLLSILLASIPIALPATFTLAAVLGSVELSGRGVLVTRLSALHDIASMTVLCSDKTGTLTRNEATVETLRPAAGFSEDDLLRAAALASDPAGQDPVDGAIIQAATARGWPGGGLTLLEFNPFDPATKFARAVYRELDGAKKWHFLKGAPAVVARFSAVPETAWQSQAEAIVARGQRVLAVARGNGVEFQLAGLLGLADAVRADSQAVIRAIQDTGVRVVMVTGDNELTARSVAEQVGIPPVVCPPAKLHGDLRGDAVDCSVFAGVLPEDKFKLVRAFQRRGAVVGMSGDGVNDAPALRQAEAGVAVANATDVAKAAAAIVLTQPGLGGVVAAIATSRLVFQRILTYTLNMLTKKIEIMALLVIGFLVTGHKPLTPMLMVLVLFLNDFLTMAISTDRMEVSPGPNRWNTRGLVLAGLALGAGRLGFSLGVFLWAYYRLALDMKHLQSLAFFTTILSSQAGVYLLRERRHFWRSRPARFLVLSSILGLGVAWILCRGGLLIPALGSTLLLTIAAGGAVYFCCLDWLKVRIFTRLSLR